MDSCGTVGKHATMSPVRRVMQTARAKPKQRRPALEIAAELVLDVSRHRPLRLVTPLEPTLKMLRRDLVERCLVGAATLVSACGTASPRGAAGSPDDRSGTAGGAAGPQPRRCERRLTSRRASRARWTMWPRRWRP
jgi:hypothetical protein